MFFHYGYFVFFPNGHINPSGDDWGPTLDSYRVGDSLGVRQGKEGVVIDVRKGDTAKLLGFDVVVVLVERDQHDLIRPAPSAKTVDAALRALHAVPEPPPTIEMRWGNHRMVAIWNTLHARPLTETFHEFLVEVPLKGTFGEDWYKAEFAKPEQERHVVERWLRSFREEGRKNRPSDHQPGQVYGAPATGATTELGVLAYDLYLLQKVNRLPDKLINRLRNYAEFQGARYEIAIAAAFVRCGFEIEWITHRTGPHPEFSAMNRRTGENVAVETKSRHRPGALHQPGPVPPADALRADVDRLYREALKQDLEDRPFAVFLDVNLPPNTEPEEAAKWQREIVDRWKGDQQQIALLGFTNFAWHYVGDNRTKTSGPEFLLSIPLASARPLSSPETARCLKVALDSYGVPPNEY